ncbi:MAG TPA: c-type cytochrome, partial [Hanamia sp.]|nr:c-type cytochrome [Hanamia sp.]
IICLAFVFGPPALSGKPDPAHLSTTPKPDWYMVPFFALFALMPHKIESVAMLLGPILTIVILFSIPFISHKGERSPLKRPWAMYGVISVIVFVVSLLVVGLKAPWSPHFDTKPLSLSAIKNKSPDSTVIKGVHLFYSKGCQYCHRISTYGGIDGPDLTTIGNRLSIQALKIRIVNGGKNMPAFGGSLSNEEINNIVTFLSSQK